MSRCSLCPPASAREAAHLTSPRLHLMSRHLTSRHVTSPHLTSPHLTSPHLTSPHLTSAQVLRNAAVIIDESHELFNDRVCDRDALWGTVLEALTRSPNGKTFLLSGTPGRSKAEVLLQLELVRAARTRRPHHPLLEETPGWQTRLAAHARGLVSFVEGSHDYSHFPQDTGHCVVDCPLALPHVALVSRLGLPRVRTANVETPAELFDPLGLDEGGAARKLAVLSARHMQAAGTVLWGGSANGLCARLDVSPAPVLTEVRCAGRRGQRAALARG